jgi:hypothetical protein
MASPESEGFLKYVGTPDRHLDGFRAALDPGAPVAFANAHGFARFDPGPDAGTPLAPSPEVSAGALSFYGFCLGDGTFHLQRLPIAVLAATLAVVAPGPRWPGDEDWTMAGLRAELAPDVAAGGPGYARAGRLFGACVDLFHLHEQGHRLDPARSPRTTAFLAGRGLLDAARFCDFPDDHQLGSWSGRRPLPLRRPAGQPRRHRGRPG